MWLFIPVIILWITTGKFNSARKLLAAISIVTVLVFHPIISSYRNARVGGVAADISAAISQSSETIKSDGHINTFSDLILTGIGGYSARVPGTDCLLIILEYEQEKGLFYYLFSKRNIDEIYLIYLHNYDTKKLIQTIATTP